MFSLTIEADEPEIRTLPDPGVTTDSILPNEKESPSPTGFTYKLSIFVLFLSHGQKSILSLLNMELTELIEMHPGVDNAKQLANMAWESPSCRDGLWAHHK
jgi:hypothetical protein